MKQWGIGSIEEIGAIEALWYKRHIQHLYSLAISKRALERACVIRMNITVYVYGVNHTYRMCWSVLAEEPLHSTLLRATTYSAFDTHIVPKEKRVLLDTDGGW